MSSSEPRLPFGEGLEEVCAPMPPPLEPGPSAPTPPPLAQPSAVAGSGPPVVAAEWAATTMSQLKGAGTLSSATPTGVLPRPKQDQDALPRLVTFSDLVFDAPPWLFSAMLHMIAVIVLGLTFIIPESTEALLLRFDYTENLGNEMIGEDLDVSLDVIDEPLDSAIEPLQITELVDTTLVEPTERPLQDKLLTHEMTPIQVSLTGRETGMQQKLLEAYGGTGATQQAVMDGLRWLARYQGRRGMWSLQGRYTDGASSENQEAATAMALLAFQGAGFTPQRTSEEPFERVVYRGWNSLLQKQKANGDFFETGLGNSSLYTHAMCTIALCELYGMTHDSKYREQTQRAVDYCVKAQSSAGGWRYGAGKGSDLSVTGWVVMALQSARMAGLEVPTATLKRIGDFLDSVSRESGVFYSYQPRQAATLSMTAEGLLCRQYLGWPHSDFRLQKGGDHLIRNLPVWKDGDRNVYYWYYATQVCHHLEGRHWRAWNDVMRVVLPAHQVQEGSERGSWDPQGDEWGSEGGRLYVTCLSIYMLEVYYRHLPIYQLENLSGN